MRCSFLVLPLLCSALSAQKADFVTPLPKADNLAAWREHILPAAAEIRWESIPWHQSFGAGLRAASAEGKPLLFYAMNGHPLGCT